LGLGAYWVRLEFFKFRSSLRTGETTPTLKGSLSEGKQESLRATKDSLNKDPFEQGFDREAATADPFFDPSGPFYHKRMAFLQANLKMA